MFYKEVPILRLLGSSRCISSDTPYKVDDEVQLVCKYLRAYKEERIDQMFSERGKYANIPVKFSTDPDLQDKECHDLLEKYMPEHIASTKITQQLFIKYVCMPKSCLLL